VHETPALPTSLEPSVPPALEAVTLRAMEKDPAARFQSAAEMTSALDERTAPLAQVAVTTPIAPVGTTTKLPVVNPPEQLPRRAERPPPRRRTVTLILGLAALILLAGLAFALFGGDRPSGLGRPTGPPSPFASRSPSTSSSTSTSPSPTPVDSVQESVTALQAIVAEGVVDGTISEKAAEQIQQGLDDAFETFGGGDIEEAVDRLGELEGKVDELVDKDEIAHSQERKLDKAIEDLADQMILASPSEGD
jgi:hypothetical protein